MPGLAYRQELEQKKAMLKYFKDHEKELEDPMTNLKPNHSAPSLTDSGYITHDQMFPNAGILDETNNYIKEHTKNKRIGK